MRFSARKRPVWERPPWDYPRSDVPKAVGISRTGNGQSRPLLPLTRDSRTALHQTTGLAAPGSTLWHQHAIDHVDDTVAL